MGKFYGEIGFFKTVDKGDGIWTNEILEKTYYGEVSKLSKRFTTQDKVNDDIQLTQQISIIADKFFYENYDSIKYVRLNGSNWKVSNIEFQRPRIILVLGGGVYVKDD